LNDRESDTVVDFSERMETNKLASESNSSENNDYIEPRLEAPVDTAISPSNGHPQNPPFPEEENNMSSNANGPSSDGFSLARPFGMSDRSRTQPTLQQNEASPSLVRVDDASPTSGSRGRERQRDGTIEAAAPVRCINPASDINSRLDTQVEVRVYPCNNSQGGGKKKFTTFTIKPEVSTTLLDRICGSHKCEALVAAISLCDVAKDCCVSGNAGSHNPRVEPKPQCQHYRSWV
jgi:hypothetical protein